MSDRYQLRFHGGNQQRYFDDRRELLECILRISGQSPDPVFEVWCEDEPVALRSGTLQGKRYSLQEVFDLSREEVLGALVDEVKELRASDGALGV